ncbi:MAG: hypothetical protein ACI9W2_005357 [Gammaproteobacteria bacterium]|jgi:hypothetical protein
MRGGPDGQAFGPRYGCIYSCSEAPDQAPDQVPGQFRHSSPDLSVRWFSLRQVTTRLLSAGIVGLSICPQARASEEPQWDGGSLHDQYVGPISDHVRSALGLRNTVRDAPERDTSQMARGEPWRTTLAKSLADIERAMNALRNLRAARLGISRAALGRYESPTESRTRPNGVNPPMRVAPNTQVPKVATTGRTDEVKARGLPTDAQLIPRYQRHGRHSIYRHRPRPTSDAFRPRYRGHSRAPVQLNQKRRWRQQGGGYTTSHSGEASNPGDARYRADVVDPAYPAFANVQMLDRCLGPLNGH